MLLRYSCRLSFVSRANTSVSKRTLIMPNHEAPAVSVYDGVIAFGLRNGPTTVGSIFSIRPCTSSMPRRWHYPTYTNRTCMWFLSSPSYLISRVPTLFGAPPHEKNDGSPPVHRLPLNDFVILIPITKVHGAPWISLGPANMAPTFLFAPRNPQRAPRRLGTLVISGFPNLL